MLIVGIFVGILGISACLYIMAISLEEFFKANEWEDELFSFSVALLSAFAAVICLMFLELLIV